MAHSGVRLGLRENAPQFALLVVLNAFVGAMVGLERSTLPLVGEDDFDLTSSAAVLSFIVAFGAAKAVTNLAAGTLATRVGRRRLLVVGWLLALPVPLLIWIAPSWAAIVAANALLGVNQGLAWSTTVVMKIDLVGPERRGLAMGLNEFAGYLALALSALGSGLIAERVGLRPEPFYLGIAFVAIGLGLSVLFVRETAGHARHEARGTGPRTVGEALEPRPTLWALLRRAAWRDRALFGACQAGLVNNLNDGLAWGLFPLFFAAAGLPLGTIGALAFIYPATSSIAQLWTGAWSDRVGRKWLIASGMAVQGIALLAMVAVSGFAAWAVCGVALGVGTAMVYPTLLAAIGDVAHPSWRGSAIGIYRLWRDLGYAVGALLAGALADAFGMGWSIGAVGAITVASGVLVAVRMPETLPSSSVLH